MASPWKFLARLVPRREQKQVDSAAKNVKPDVLAIAGPTEISVEDSLDIVHKPSKHLQSANRSEAVSIDPDTEEGGDVSFDIAKSDEAKQPQTSEPAPSDVDHPLVHARLEGDESAKVVPVQRRTRGRNDDPSTTLSQVSPTALSVSDAMRSLDQDIGVLRVQLASRLRLQNAQLKRMLERFER